MYNWKDTVQKQFGSSTRLLQMISDFNQYIDPTVNLDAFYNNIWNVETATGYGLDVWGRIVGVTRVLQVGTTVNLGATGPAGTSGDSMNVAPFYSGGPTTTNYSLTDDAFRQLIYAKALFNISNGSTQAINNILMLLFGSSGQCWVIDNLNMSMVYHFAFTPTPVQLAIISQSNVLPRPSGISATVTYT